MCNRACNCHAVTHPPCAVGSKLAHCPSLNIPYLINVARQHASRQYATCEFLQSHKCLSTRSQLVLACDQSAVYRLTRLRGLAHILGCAATQDLKPDIVYARISGYGQTGPKSQLAGYASVCEAYGGFRYSAPSYSLMLYLTLRALKACIAVFSDVAQFTCNISADINRACRDAQDRLLWKTRLALHIHQLTWAGNH